MTHAKTPAPTDGSSLAARDARVLWHPCTQMKDHEALPPVAVRRGEGAWLEDFAGKRYLDAVSSWWVNLFGHANPGGKLPVTVPKHVGQVPLYGSGKPSSALMRMRRARSESWSL